MARPFARRACSHKVCLGAVSWVPHQGVSIFSQHEGGLCGAADEHGGRWVYVMGIIDTLQTYTLHKQVRSLGLHLYDCSAHRT